MTWLEATRNTNTVYDTDPQSSDLSAALDGYAELLSTPGSQFQWWVNDEGAISGKLPQDFVVRASGLPLYGAIVGVGPGATREALLDEFRKLFKLPREIEELTNDSLTYVGLSQLEARLLAELLIANGAVQSLTNGKLSPEETLKAYTIAAAAQQRANRVFTRMKEVSQSSSQWFYLLGQKLLAAVDG